MSSSLPRFPHQEADTATFLAPPGEETPGLLAPIRVPVGLSLHRCKMCGTRWLRWSIGVWNLLDQYQRPGACCDNADMGEQIEHLRDIIPAAPPGEETPANGNVKVPPTTAMLEAIRDA